MEAIMFGSRYTHAPTGAIRPVHPNTSDVFRYLRSWGYDPIDAIRTFGALEVTAALYSGVSPFNVALEVEGAVETRLAEAYCR